MPFKVLIVEDDAVTAEVNRVSLQRVGFAVELVDRGDEAIAAMRNGRPDVVVLDLELPGQNGVQILQQMQLDPELRKLIVIAHTAHADANDSLGFSYFAQYLKAKQDEPLIIEKVEKGQDSWRGLRLAIAKAVGEKFGSIPKGLSEWIETKERR